MNAAKANETARHIRSLLGKNRIDDALAALHDFFTSIQDKNRLNDVIALQARFYGLSQAITRGTISETEAGIQRGQICNSILLMLDAIAPDTSPPAPSKPVKKGKLLHNIPDSMRIGEVTECRIRIATTEKQARKNFSSAAHVETISLERIGERMEVRLVAADSGAFIIKRQNKHARQIIESEAHTEWVFDVIPMKTGKQKLFLKVDIILEEKSGKAYRDEVISVPVDVCTTEAVAAPEWRQAADLMPKPGAKNFIGSIFAGFLGKNQRENSKRAAAALAVGIVGLAMAAIFREPVSALIDQWVSEGNLPAGDRLHSVGIVVHSPADTAVDQFTVSSQTLAMSRIMPGVWEALVRVPDDSTRHDIYYRGNAARGYWEDVLLKDQIVHLFVLSTDTARCGVYVEIDTVVYPAERWRLVWMKNAVENIFFSVQPISDTTFFVPLGNWCQTLRDPRRTYDFQFVNGPCRLIAYNVSLTKYPTTLIFRKRPPVRITRVSPPLKGKKKIVPVAGLRPVMNSTPQRLMPKPVKKVKISLTLPPKWARHVQDMEITVDGSHFSSDLPFENGKIPFELPPSAESREICISIFGQKTGEPISIGCYEGPIEPDMKLEIMDGRIIRK